MHSFFFAIAAFVISSGVNAQDTLRSSHKFELPFGNAAAYEGAIAQQPAEIHDFVFTARDSGTVFIVLRSENDSLDIRLDREAIKKRKKENGLFIYGTVKAISPGEKTFTIRCKQYSVYTVYAKGLR